MKFNICIIQPKDYVHSMAFLELAELLLYSLRDLNHNVEIQVNKIDSYAKNILIGFHLLDIEYINQVPKDTILVNVEQFLGGIVLTENFHKNFLAWAQSFEIWDYSYQNIDALKKMGLNNIKYLKLGYQKELTRITKSECKDIDILFYGSINDRRAKILDQLKSFGLNVHAIFGVYGKPRDDLIARSKIVLNLHYYDSQIFEVVRVFYLLCNSAATIGEINKTTLITEPFKTAIIAASYEELVETCVQFAQNPSLAEAKGSEGFDIFKKYPQKIYTESLLEGLKN